MDEQFLNKKAKSMRIHFRLPKQFWVNTVNITTYLINQCPLVPLRFKIPEEYGLEKR